VQNLRIKNHINYQPREILSLSQNQKLNLGEPNNCHFWPEYLNCLHIVKATAAPTSKRRREKTKNTGKEDLPEESVHPPPA
jgi:hypothetical protein